MIVDGVNFNEAVVAAMSEEEFIERHLGHFWRDKDEATRRKKLKQAYELTAKKPAKPRKRRAESE